MLFFADPAEGVVVQATMMGGVIVLVASLLLLLSFLDNPYRGDVGALKPTAMQTTLKVLQQDAFRGPRDAVGRRAAEPSPTGSAEPTPPAVVASTPAGPSGPCRGRGSFRAWDDRGRR